MSELGYYDFLEAEKAGIPVRICHAHNRPYGIDIKSPVRWYYKTLMIPHISHMFMCGEESGEWLFGKKNKSKFIQLNNAIDAKNYSYNEVKRAEVRKSLGLTEELVVGHVGRFNPQKNHSFIIDVFNEVHKKEPDSVLLLVGDDSGKVAEDIHKKVDEVNLAGAVRFLGVRTDVADLMQAMDVFLFPSLFEGFGIAALEAQAAGLPAVVSKRIPPECMITDCISSLELDFSAEIWANRLIEAAKNERKNRFSEIKRAGFDIAENAKFLQDFYIRAASGEK